MRNLVSLSRYLAVPVLSLALVACGGGGGGSDDDDDEEALENINGTYRSECFRTSATASTEFTYVARNGELTITRSDYLDGACSVNRMDTVTTADYELGDVVSQDGSVDNITSATEIDLTSTSAPTVGEISYSIVARQGDLAYIGEDSGSRDGTTRAKRHRQLDEDFPLTRQ